MLQSMGIKMAYQIFLIYSKKFPEFIIVIEAKADVNKLMSETKDNYADYAVDGGIIICVISR